MSSWGRPRFARLFSRARWSEYRRALEDARAAGYRVIGLDGWVAGASEGSEQPVLIVRHDVDQHPLSALRMATVERDLGVVSTWYFRWRTADPGVIRAVRDMGASIGLHYETLSRIALERGLAAPEEVEAVLPEARRVLRDEIQAFQDVHGPIRSICAHGDTRAPHARNTRLVEDEIPASFGIEFEAYEAMRGHRLGHWLTDRSRADGRWVGGVRPDELFRSGLSPILAVVHPNTWASGVSLSVDRALGMVLTPRDQASGSPRTRVVRTRSDIPPIAG